MKLVSAFIGTAIVFLALDLGWIGVVANSFYREQMGPLMAQPLNATAAVAFYTLFVLGVMIFAVQPSLTDGGVARAAMLGAMFGFFTYMTYNLTGLSVIKDFSGKLALVDIAWGTVLTAVSAGAGSVIGSRF